MNLPLLENATKGTLPVSVLANGGGGVSARCGSAAELPAEFPGEGEQYRFHFDMTKCIGCECCVVACNEQNGNPADIHWRRVGEIEGGSYPETLRAYLSMGCNHCLEPPCLEGCPVDAYTKDPLTGIVLHSAERCIGCQYCTWNCSYGVPQYNPERGVVGKCDMCYGRLAEQRTPACVGACPEGAIQIEIVAVAEWRAGYAAAANAPGLPSADDSISTTRITLPSRIPADTRKADANRVRPEDPHWPLVFMTVLTQMSVGGFCAVLLEQFAGLSTALRPAAAAALLVAALALGASTMHLGRPAYAWRALRMWRRSWLSREVLLFGLFAGFGLAYAATLWLGGAGSVPTGLCTVAAGAAGIFASARIYCVRARPAWNSSHTVAEFFLSAALSGPLFAALLLAGGGHRLLTISSASAGAILLQQFMKLLWLGTSEGFELRATAGLIARRLRSRTLFRFAGLIGVAALLPHAHGAVMTGAALALALCSEVAGRWLFFVSVVPKNMAASYLREAA